jgi:kynureninase
MNLSDKAQHLDRQDPLASLRNQFQLPEGVCYLDGNSLGALSIPAREAVQTTVDDEWGQDLISSWNTHDWIGLPTRVGDAIGRLIGAAPGQTLCADNLSINLYKLVHTALQYQPDRSVIVTEPGNFPTDNYVLQGIAQSLGESRCQIRYLTPEEILTSDLSDVALVCLTHVNFRTGAMADMPAITRKVQSQGSLMLWDLAHSVGATDLQLDAWGVDMAVGCTYKYLNAGPGAPGFLYLAERHIEQAQPAISGWMGHADLFAFEAGYRPAQGIARFLTGTQGVLGMRATEAALQVLASTSASALRQKSEAMTSLFMEAVAEQPLASQLPCLTPGAVAARGSQICLTHPEGYAIAQALIAAGVVVDFRAPDIIRFGFAPAYLRFSEVVGAAEVLEDILRTEVWREPRFSKRQKVT